MQSFTYTAKRVGLIFADAVSPNRRAIAGMSELLKGPTSLRMLEEVDQERGPAVWFNELAIRPECCLAMAGGDAETSNPQMVLKLVMLRDALYLLDRQSISHRNVGLGDRLALNDLMKIPQGELPSVARYQKMYGEPPIPHQHLQLMKTALYEQHEILAAVKKDLDNPPVSTGENVDMQRQSRIRSSVGVLADYLDAHAGTFQKLSGMAPSGRDRSGQ